METELLQKLMSYAVAAYIYLYTIFLVKDCPMKTK